MTKGEAIASAEKFQVWTYRLSAGALEYTMRSEHSDLEEARAATLPVTREHRVLLVEIVAIPSGDAVWCCRGLPTASIGVLPRKSRDAA